MLSKEKLHYCHTWSENRSLRKQTMATCNYSIQWNSHEISACLISSLCRTVAKALQPSQLGKPMRCACLAFRCHLKWPKQSFFGGSYHYVPYGTDPLRLILTVLWTYDSDIELDIWRKITFDAVGFSFWCRNPMLRFGVLPSVDVACEECCRCMQRCWFPQTKVKSTITQKIETTRLPSASRRQIAHLQDFREPNDLCRLCVLGGQSA